MRISTWVAAALVAAAGTVTAPAFAQSDSHGLAAVYTDKLQGHKTANGERYDRGKLTAAHQTLPLGSRAKVTNVKNNKSVVVRINDRGPTQPGRVIDLSRKAAQSIGINPRGMGEVRVEHLGKPAAK
ncbi:MAG: septal ring lytic transglycosylase RlpA family protein [Burkholderiaceae bacterium]